MNSGGGGRPGRWPVRQQERRRDYRKQCDGGHEWDGIDPDGQQEPYP